MAQEKKDGEETQRKETAENRPGSAGTATRRAEETKTTGDPGRTPGKAEGVKDPEEEGNE